MELDDFFAKKDKKKSKTKQNPHTLMKKMTKDLVKIKKDQIPEPSEPKKSVIQSGEQNDEWENLDDDDKEIDLQNIRIGKLNINEDASKHGQKDREKKDGDENEVGEKKVWGGRIEPKEEAPIEVPEEPVVEPEVAATPKVYVPAPLRQGGGLSSLNSTLAKPNVSSVEDFPTLDAAVATTAEAAVKKTKQPAPISEEHSDLGWQQAGTPRRAPRGSEVPTPVAETRTSVYMPPSMRHAGEPLPSSTTREYGGGLRNTRYRDDPVRQESGGRRYGFDDQPSRTPFSATSDDDWNRAQNMGTYSVVTTSVPTPRRPTLEQDSSIWSRGSAIKSFKDSSVEKPTFELPQSNRFAGLSET